MSKNAAEPEPAPDSEPSRADRLARQLEQQARRHQRNNRGRAPSLWQQVARVGTLGWMIVLPIVAGALVGHLLDLRFDSGVRWALALMFLGLITGGYALYRAMQEGMASRGER
ncbi:AtpZ/AtpI family protein [Enhygromyxa salina]|uniref:Putative F0F1-ATPase subunit n=1 Tax=Enhygromyxa salina TaxID=215803 RepID=A0A2S9XPR5_9BACT|nr:AtpZ/AtpI family protein [Enhygromyxa salina]PRP94853.1 putative F0F1-ATPase subunit [Enhygromyxa salina]